MKYIRKNGIKDPGSAITHGIALILAVVFSPLLGGALSSLFWFVTYRFTVAPILAVLPAFALLGVLVPLAVYRSVAKHTIVERLREAES